MKRAAISVAAALSWLVAQPVAALSYSALPFSGTVVDADSKQPIEGVIVDASWRLEGRLGSGLGVLYSTERVTDQQGRFSMPAWGPLEVKAHAEGEALPARMGPNEPVLYLFKPGYEPKQTGLKYYDSSYLNDPWSTGDAVRAVANNRTVELRRSSESETQYRLTLMLWSSHLAFINDCGWTRAPRMTIAMIREGERLKHVTGRNENEILDPRFIHEREGDQYCGSTKPILDEAMK